VISVSEKSRVAVDALVELAGRGSGDPVPILEVAERRGVAVHVLEQIFSSLRRAGILQSQRGVHGGYSLRRPAESVTVIQVVAAVDGPFDEAAAGIWLEARDALASVLSGATIASLLERERRTAPMFYI
jgi:Rrf2 family transcriptional regulator, cysteine metabolism repressor